MKTIIKVKLGEKVPSNAVLIKIEKEKSYEYGEWYGGDILVITEYAYYEIEEI